MEKSIFRYILHYSKKQQIYLLFLTLVSFPALYYSLELPKVIINQVIKISPSEFKGVEVFGQTFDQIEYLMLLSLAYLGLVLIGGALKYHLNVFRGILSERLLRRMRYMLIERIMRFPLPHFRKASQGEIVSMMVSETQPLGGFFGEAFSLPAFQGGTLLVILVFIFVQNPIIGLAAVSLYPFQIYFIPKLQKMVNQIAKERVREVRKFSERVGEIVSGAAEIHAHGTAQYELADISNRLGSIFGARVRIFVLKFLIKFINNFIAQLTPFFFFSIGGYLVLVDQLSLGALVAVLAAYKDLAPPWKELLQFYQTMEDVRIKYEQLVEQFSPPGMLDERLIAYHPDATPAMQGTLKASNLVLEDEGERVIDGATFSLETSQHAAMIGPGSGGKTAVARLVARQLLPTSGQIMVGGVDIATVPDQVLARNIAYVDQEAYISAGTIGDNLFYGLKHRPRIDFEGEDEAARKAREKWIQEALKAGNSPFDITADWIDYAALGLSSPAELKDRAVAILRHVSLEEDVFQFGLKKVIDPAAHPQLAEGVLEARAIVAKKLADPAYAGLVEQFDAERFNSSASIAENILFGTPVGEAFDVNDLARNPYVRQVLDKVGLTKDILDIGKSIAALMVELFKDLPPGHELHERFSFIDPDQLADFQAVLREAESKGLEGLGEAERARLSELPFKLVPSRHRLNLIDAAMQERLLEARRLFHASLAEELKGAIEFFDAERYNSAINIQDNILFGKIADTRAQSLTRIGELLADVIGELGMHAAMLDVGLTFDVGIAGKRLSAAQRQKLAVARALLKQPRVIVLNEAVTALDPASQMGMLDTIKAEMTGRGIIWVDGKAAEEGRFDRVLSVEQGSVKELTIGAPRREAAVAAPAEGQPAAATEGEEMAGGLRHETVVLSNIPFFAGVDRSRLKLLAFASEREVFEPGEALFHQGEKADYAYVILEGSYEVIVETPTGPRTISRGGRGELIGELALLCEVGRTASVRASDRLTVLKIASDVFMELIKENAAVAANVMRIISTRLIQTMRDIGGPGAEYDRVTGLPNRDLFLHRVRSAVNEGKRRDKTAVLIVAHLKDLEKLGRDLDEPGRDELLRSLSQRLKGCLRRSDTLGHVDESGLGIIAQPGQKEVNPEVVLKRLSDALAAPVRVNSQDIHLSQGVDFDVYVLDEENLERATRLFDRT